MNKIVLIAGFVILFAFAPETKAGVSIGVGIGVPIGYYPPVYPAYYPYYYSYPIYAPVVSVGYYRPWWCGRRVYYHRHYY